MSVPSNRSAPETVVVEEDIVPRGFTFMKVKEILEIVKGLEVVVVLHHHTGDAAEARHDGA